MPRLEDFGLRYTHYSYDSMNCSDATCRARPSYTRDHRKIVHICMYHPSPAPAPCMRRASCLTRQPISHPSWTRRYKSYLKKRQPTYKKHAADRFPPLPLPPSTPIPSQAARSIPAILTLLSTSSQHAQGIQGAGALHRDWTLRLLSPKGTVNARHRPI